MGTSESAVRGAASAAAMSSPTFHLPVLDSLVMLARTARRGPPQSRAPCHDRAMAAEGTRRGSLPTRRELLRTAALTDRRRAAPRRLRHPAGGRRSHTSPDAAKIGPGRGRAGRPRPPDDSARPGRRTGPQPERHRQPPGDHPPDPGRRPALPADVGRSARTTSSTVRRPARPRRRRRLPRPRSAHLRRPPRRTSRPPRPLSSPRCSPPSPTVTAANRAVVASVVASCGAAASCSERP